jgi:tetratricopeptide (TPR) repeat protein
VAAGQIIDEDPELALQHAIAARRIASRIGVVREAVGLAAYAAGDWATAIAELRTYHRMSGKQTHLAEIADSERALGRPERAIDLFRGADRDALDKAGAIELLIVAAGARGDLGQHDAAVAMLQVRELTADEDAEWAARLRYAYADALLAAGRREEAREWFARAAAADPEDLTDANERLLELDGVVLEEDETDDDEESQDTEDGAHEDGFGAAGRADESDVDQDAEDGGLEDGFGAEGRADGSDVDEFDAGAGADDVGRDGAQFESDALVDLAGDEPVDDVAAEADADAAGEDGSATAEDADADEKAQDDQFVASAEDEPVADPGAEPVSHAGGEPTVEADGEPVAEAGGEPVAEAGVEPVSHAGGEPVAGASGEPVAHGDAERRTGA